MAERKDCSVTSACQVCRTPSDLRAFHLYMWHTTTNHTYLTLLILLHCKNIRISTDILWRVFLVPYTLVCVNGQNNEVRVHTAVWAHASLFHRCRWMQTYKEPVPLKYGKLTTKYLWIYRYFIQFTTITTTTTFHFCLTDLLFHSYPGSAGSPIT